MITPIITTLGEFLAVRLPEGADKCKVSELYLGYQWLEYPDRTGCTKIPLPPGSWEILDFASKLTEEQCGSINPDAGKLSGFTTNKENFVALLKSHGIYLVNPLGETMPNTMMYHKGEEKAAEQIFKAVQQKWQSAEEKVFNPLILKHKNQTK